jgi:small subunit ribosomal protein S15
MSAQLKDILSVSKQNLIKLFETHEGDTGSAQVQIAIITQRILHLSDHLKRNPNDVLTKRSLLIMISKRRKLMMYLKNKDVTGYATVISKLGLRSK